MISIIINADTRSPMDRETFTVGDDGGEGSLHGCRSWDYLTDLPKVVHKFFEGHEHKIILYVDVHLQIPPSVIGMWDEYMREGWFTFTLTLADHTSHRWNDRLYLTALQKAEWDYVVHTDQDCALFRDESSDIVSRYLKWLDEGYKFICQPTNLTKQQHGMWWASTRFFICKRETLDFDALWKALDDPFSLFDKYPWNSVKHFPCLEHLLGVLAGENGVLYPPREDENYVVFSWARYIKNTLSKLHAMSYQQVEDIICKRFGLCGPNDCLAQPI